MQETLVFEAEHLRCFAIRVFEACGAPSDEARIVADHLVVANLRGYDSHGIIRIPQYLEDVRNKIIWPGATISIETETETTAIVDCGWNFGQIGGYRAMEVAIAKARRYHTATVVTRRCNHVGRLGAYTEIAAKQELIAIGVCNSPRHGHFVLPWGGRKGRLATNPISFAVPNNSGDPILADFSTAEAPEGRIRLYRNQGKTLPNGWIVDSEGNPTSDPSAFYGPPQGGILPFGGDKGYRGFALSLFVEILGGLLSGSRTTVDQPGNGVGLIVVDISAFLPHNHFSSLIDELRDYIKSSPPSQNFEEVLLPGEKDIRLEQRRLHDGIPIDQTTWEQIISSAASVGVEQWPAPKTFKVD